MERAGSTCARPDWRQAEFRQRVAVAAVPPVCRLATVLFHTWPYDAASAQVSSSRIENWRNSSEVLLSLAGVFHAVAVFEVLLHDVRQAQAVAVGRAVLATLARLLHELEDGVESIFFRGFVSQSDQPEKQAEEEREEVGLRRRLTVLAWAMRHGLDNHRRILPHVIRQHPHAVRARRPAP